MATVSLLTRLRTAGHLRFLNLSQFNKSRCFSSVLALTSGRVEPRNNSYANTSLCVLPCQTVSQYRNYARISTKSPTQSANKTDAKASSTAAADLFGDAANKGLFAKFKHMYKQYWYVLIPVHVVTSLGWFGGFYYLSKSGVDVPALLQYVHLSETIIEKVQGSDMGHYAIAYLCYKVTTPLRYAVTLGGTTLSIKYLVQTGHIKPMPSKRQLIKMYEDQKAARSNAKAGHTGKDDSSHTNTK